MKQIILAAALSLSFLALQGQEDLRRDSAFFHIQKETYQRWLEFEGMGNVLQVHALGVDSNQVDMYLAFFSENPDTVFQLWRQLKIDFETRNPVRLEQHLLYKMAQLMEVGEEQSRVLLFESYDVYKTPDPCFVRVIYFSGGKVEVLEENCRTEIRDFRVERPKLSTKSKIEGLSFDVSAERKEAFDAIYAYAMTRFGAKQCEGRKAQVILRERDQVLRFEVKDLCKEVITESRAPLICQWLPIDCKERREWLIFTVAYEKSANGFKLTCSIDAKVGSGFFGSVGRGAFYDMELDFKPYLKDYADSFKLELQQLF